MELNQLHSNYKFDALPNELIYFLSKIAVCVFGTPCGIRTHTVWDLNPTPLPIGLREHGTKFNDIDLASYYIPQHLVSWVMRPSQSGGTTEIRTLKALITPAGFQDQTPHHTGVNRTMLPVRSLFWRGFGGFGRGRTCYA